MSTPTQAKLALCGGLLLFAFVGTTQAQFKSDAATSKAPVVGPAPAAPDTELLHTAKVKVTRGDYDTQLLRLPPDARGGFGANIDRINALLRALLLEKTLAQSARDTGLDKDPEVQRQVKAEVERVLAAAQMQRNVAKWEAEFNARPNLEQAAKERWLTREDRFRGPDDVKVTVIRYSATGGSIEAAKAKATAARERILQGGDMSAIAKAESNDASASAGGKLDWRSLRSLADLGLPRGASVPREKGEVSRVIEGPDAVWLVRLDDRRPGAKRDFEDVKPQIIADLRRDYVEQQQQTLQRSVRDDPSIVVNQPAVDALVVRIDGAVAAPAAPSAAMPGAPGAAQRGKGQGKGRGQNAPATPK